ncbi:MAG: TlpA family protein disulfide reductase [Betaproteobacteria bacterium]|nr:TlpA family protein disulfide reductase [Betaproteobacteria bacterium]
MKLPIFKLVALIALLFAIWEGISVYRSLHYWNQGSGQAPAPMHAALPPLLELSLPDLAQRMQSMQQWQGRVLVVNFWASWCEPCKDEMPMLKRLQATWPSDRVQFVGIGIDEREAIAAYLQHQPMNYPMLLGTQETLDLTAPYGNAQSGIPFTLVFDPAGQIIMQKLGRVSENELQAAIVTASHARQS